MVCTAMMQDWEAPYWTADHEKLRYFAAASGLCEILTYQWLIHQTVENEVEYIDEIGATVVVL